MPQAIVKIEEKVDSDGFKMMCNEVNGEKLHIYNNPDGEGFLVKIPGIDFEQVYSDQEIIQMMHENLVSEPVSDCV